MSHMTKVPGVPDKDDVHPGMAYFSNTGPFCETCGTCAHRGYRRKIYVNGVERMRNTNGCALFNKMTGKHGGVVQPEWLACKFWEKIDDRR
jgi:hypothetical protein